MPNDDFATLSLQAALHGNLAGLGFTKMTPVQQLSLPAILQGQDVIAQAQTGSGKTVAFGLGVLQRIEPKQTSVQALVLCPTRELADQVAQELRRLARAIPNIKVLTLCGGAPLGPQIGSLQHGAHIVVGTPGRIEDHLRKRSLNTGNLLTLVLDEADRMLDMGFQDSLDAIINQLPENRQSLLFSATFPPQIDAIAQRVTHGATHVQVDGNNDSASGIEERFVLLADESQRLPALVNQLLQLRPTSALVFCNTRKATQEVVSELRMQGFSAMALHGELDQRERERTLTCFANHSVSVLVATDVAARGLDIDDLELVLNHALAREADVHVHRVGRTGRAGNSGLAVSLLTEQERWRLERITGDGQLADITLFPEANSASALSAGGKSSAYRPPMRTLQISGGKKAKLRPGDILGALTAGQAINADQVGRIHITPFCSYVAVTRHCANDALRIIQQDKVKGRSFQVRLLPE